MLGWYPRGGLTAGGGGKGGKGGAGGAGGFFSGVTRIPQVWLQAPLGFGDQK